MHTTHTVKPLGFCNLFPYQLVSFTKVNVFLFFVVYVVYIHVKHFNLSKRFFLDYIHQERAKMNIQKQKIVRTETGEELYDKKEPRKQPNLL